MEVLVKQGEEFVPHPDNAGDPMAFFYAVRDALEFANIHAYIAVRNADGTETTA